MKQYDVYGIGHALLDTEYPVTDSLLEQLGVVKGQSIQLDQATHQVFLAKLEQHTVPIYRSCGGSVANSVLALQSLGGRAYYASAVAEDAAGKHYLQELAEGGVAFNTEACLKNRVTGQSIIMITPDTERSMSTFLGAAVDLNVEHIDNEALRHSRVLMIEGYIASVPHTLEAVLAVKAQHRAAGGETAISFCDPFMVENYREQLSLLLEAGVDLLFCNEQEARLWGQQDLDRGINALLKRTKVLVVTLGAKGAGVFVQNHCIKITAAAVTAKNTLGAGDNFAGAFLYAYTQGYSLEQAGCLASHVAATVVTQEGPRLSAKQYSHLSHQILPPQRILAR